MKKSYLLIILCLFSFSMVKAQTTAMNFTMNDCNGQMHNLYSELDGNNVVVLEFFMTNCSPCVTAGNKIETMVDNANNDFMGYVKYYHFGFNNSYSCATISNWVNSNAFNSVPFDSGAAQVAYYGGFGMPTVVIVAGNTHQVLFSTVGFSTSDTTQMGIAIRNYFAGNPVGIAETEQISSFAISPNPVSNTAVVTLNIKNSTRLTLQLADINGNLIEEIISADVNSGNFSYNINVQHLASGIYIVKAITSGSLVTTKLNVIRQ